MARLAPVVATVPAPSRRKIRVPPAGARRAARAIHRRPARRGLLPVPTRGDARRPRRLHHLLPRRPHHPPRAAARSIPGPFSHRQPPTNLGWSIAFGPRTPTTLHRRTTLQGCSPIPVATSTTVGRPAPVSGVRRRGPLSARPDATQVRCRPATARRNAAPLQNADAGGAESSSLSPSCSWWC